MLWNKKQVSLRPSKLNSIVGYLQKNPEFARKIKLLKYDGTLLAANQDEKETALLLIEALVLCSNLGLVDITLPPGNPQYILNYLDNPFDKKR